jgi:hypothetical protein
LVDVLAEFQGIKMGHDFIEDAAGTILHGANDVGCSRCYLKSEIRIYLYYQ